MEPEEERRKCLVMWRGHSETKENKWYHHFVRWLPWLPQWQAVNTSCSSHQSWKENKWSERNNPKRYLSKHKPSLNFVFQRFHGTRLWARDRGSRGRWTESISEIMKKGLPKRFSLLEEINALCFGVIVVGTAKGVLISCFFLEFCLNFWILFWIFFLLAWVWISCFDFYWYDSQIGCSERVKSWEWCRDDRVGDLRVPVKLFQFLLALWEWKK